MKQYLNNYNEILINTMINAGEPHNQIQELMRNLNETEVKHCLKCKENTKLIYQENGILFAPLILDIYFSEINDSKTLMNFVNSTLLNADSILK